MTGFSWTLPGGGGVGGILPPGGVPQQMSAIDQARASMFVDQAEGKWLTRIGMNYGVPRAFGDPNNDELYSKLVQLLAWQPKTIYRTTYTLAEIIFGSRASIQALGNRAWELYEVIANEIILEIPATLIAGSNDNTSYAHGFVGAATRVGAAPSEFFTTPGDITAAADDVVGLFVSIWDTDFWNEFEIQAASYDPITGLSTVEVDWAGVPDGAGNPCYVDVPGDDVSSYQGDFMAPDASEWAGQTLPATVEPARRVYLFGQGAVDTFVFYATRLVKAAGVTLRVEVI